MATTSDTRLIDLPFTFFQRACRFWMSWLDLGAPHDDARITRPDPTAARYFAVEHTTHERAAVERFIDRAFERQFDAHIADFMPRLFSMRDAQARICGAFGLRSATQRLFVEQYLDRPIEDAIRAQVGGDIRRNEIVEVGHFSGNFPGAMRTLIGLVARQLYREGAEWVVFTGTSAMRNAFHRCGMFPIDIGAASREAVPESAREGWGNYYAHHPRVFVGRVVDGVKRLHAVEAEKISKGSGAHGQAD